MLPLLHVKQFMNSVRAAVHHKWCFSQDVPYCTPLVMEPFVEECCPALAGLHLQHVLQENCCVYRCCIAVDVVESQYLRWPCSDSSIWQVICFSHAGARSYWLCCLHETFT